MCVCGGGGGSKHEVERASHHRLSEICLECHHNKATDCWLTTEVCEQGKSTSKQHNYVLCTLCHCKQLALLLSPCHALPAKSYRDDDGAIVMVKLLVGW